jgi:WD40 repeat protein
LRLGGTYFRNGGPVRQLDFALGSEAIVSINRELLHVWGIPSGNELLSIKSSRSLYVLAVSSDGLTAAGGTLDIGNVVLFDLERGKELSTFQAHQESISYLGFSSDNKALVTASGSDECGDCTLRVWQLRGKKSRDFDCHLAVTALALSSDGQMLASATGSTISLWDFASGRLLREWKDKPTAYWHSLAFSPDGKQLASADEKGMLRVWNPSTGKRLRRMQAHQGPVYALAYSPEGERILSAGADCLVRSWDVGTGEAVGYISGLAGVPRCLRYDRKGHWLTWGGDDSKITLWDREKEEAVTTPSGHEDIVFRVAYTLDGRRVVTGSRDATAAIWDATTGERQALLVGHRDMIRGLTLSPDGKLIATASNDKTVRLWSAITGKQRRVLVGHRDHVSTVAFSANGKTLASGGDDGTVRFWNLATGKVRHVLKAHPKARIEHIAFSRDGLSLVTVGSTYHVVDKSIRFWDLNTFVEVRRIEGPDYQTYDIGGLSFSPNGNILAWSCQDGQIYLLNLSGNEPPRMLRGHPRGYTNEIAFSPDGKLLASGSSYDSLLRLWDVATGKQLRAVPGHSSGIESVTFSPDGLRLASASKDTTVLIWEVATLLGKKGKK